MIVELPRVRTARVGAPIEEACEARFCTVTAAGVGVETTRFCVLLPITMEAKFAAREMIVPE